MAYVITENCVDCKFTYCAAVCPVEAFHEAPDRLYINAETCIDCDACVSECPVQAIFPDYEVPDHLEAWIAENEKEAPKHPVIATAKEPLKGPRCVNPNAR